MDEIGILPAFHGRLMRDRLSSYDHYDCDQSVCGSHLLRDCAGIAVQAGQQWAARMEEALETMNNVAHYWRRRGVTSVPQPLRDWWVTQYFTILAAGYAAQPPPSLTQTLPKRKGPPKQTEASNLLDAFLKRAEQVLAFMDDLSWPFTNNQAERDLRMAKVQQKISGTFRSHDGATAFCRIRSYLSTMSKQGHPMLAALAAVFDFSPSSRCLDLLSLSSSHVLCTLLSSYQKRLATTLCLIWLLPFYICATKNRNAIFLSACVKMSSGKSIALPTASATLS